MADTSETEAQSVPAAQSQAVMDQSVLGNYIRRIVPVNLEDSDDTPAALVTCLKEKATMDAMKKFISDPQVACLLIQRQAAKGKTLTGEAGPPVCCQMDSSMTQSLLTLVKIF